MLQSSHEAMLRDATLEVNLLGVILGSVDAAIRERAEPRQAIGPLLVHLGLGPELVESLFDASQEALPDPVGA